MSWPNLLRKRLPAPWVPSVRGPFDATFFDEQYDENEEAPIRTVDNKGQTYEELVKQLPEDWDKEFDETVPRPRHRTCALQRSWSHPPSGWRKHSQ